MYALLPEGTPKRTASWHSVQTPVKRAHLDPVQDIGTEVGEELKRIGRDSAIAVLPEGPMTIPYLSNAAH